ncbi:type IV pilus biogenesis protein PilM [Humisphaera borealis]|uniref:GspL periplasmic domain-containing protein n=1 Tax=Humisphaera borealis TaxID=2807512 RepID=A0A7M2WZZ2_9BACT|nr:hypothetical protein [Humisphaera borealis]QOV90973.1 hypothetical protein IPV69_06325 [Humisphaera borealis]
MSISHVILVPPEQPGDSPRQGDAWRIGQVVNGVAAWTTIAGADSDPMSLAAAVQKAGVAGKPLVLALPSSWCLAATFPVTGLPRGDHKAMLYRFEERLPIAAESVVADFIISPAGDMCLGVCTRTERVRPWVDALEAAGVTVRSIAPLALLIAAGISTANPAARTAVSASAPSRALVCTAGFGGGFEIIALQGRSPIGWFHGAGTPADITRRIDWLGAMLGTDLVIEQLGSDIPDSVLAEASVAVAKKHALSPAAAALAGAAMLGTSGAAAIDLRRDALAPADRFRAYRGGLRAVAAAAIVFLTAVAAAALVRSQQYLHAAETADAQKLTDVRSAFPAALGSATADEVRTLLAQERRSWSNSIAGGAVSMGTVDGTGTGKPKSASGSALRTLRDVIKLLPDNNDIRIDTTMFAETTFQLSGRARSYDDIEKLATAIRAGHPDVSVSQARRGTDGHWNFTLGGATTAATAAR